MRLHVHEWGEGRPVVCLHGVTGHGERFRRIAQERLADRRVVAPDLRGHGRSGWEPPWNLETHVADVVETVDHLGIDAADWVGFSLGGRLAAHVAHEHAARVDRLVLLDPALQLSPRMCLEYAEEERAGETFGSPEEAVDAKLASGSLVSCPRALIEEDVRQHLVAREDGRLAYRYCASAAVAIFGELSRPAPPVARVPTLIMLGSESYVPGEEQAARYREELGDAVAVETLHSGHSLLFDAFDATAEAVSAFLRPPPGR